MSLAIADCAIGIPAELEDDHALAREIVLEPGDVGKPLLP
jgi:hypothetical protein